MTLLYVFLGIYLFGAFLAAVGVVWLQWTASPEERQSERWMWTVPLFWPVYFVLFLIELLDQ